MTTTVSGSYPAVNSDSDATINGLTVGKGAGSNAFNTTVGSAALAGSNTGANNTAIGYGTLFSNTSGASGTAIGTSALLVNTTGSYNTAVGHQALTSNTTASGNTAVGYTALYTTTTGANNTAVGYGALSSVSTKSSNTAIGYQTGLSADCNEGVFIGMQSGYQTTGDSNIFIGYYTGVSTTNGNNNIIIGRGSVAAAFNSSNSIAIGQNTTAKGNDTGFINPNGGGVYQGNNSSSWSTTSDQRLKKNIVDNNTGLEKIVSIQVRNFEYRLPEEVDAELKSTDAIPNKGVQLGVIAQELAQVLPECVKTESTGVMSVDTDNLTWYLINAVKELNAKITALENK